MTKRNRNLFIVYIFYESCSKYNNFVNRHRAGVELLAMALEHRDSPWQGALVALRATLPAIDGEQAEAVAKLLRDGPETEEVGLEPYGIDPFLNPRPDEDAELLGV